MKTVKSRQAELRQKHIQKEIKGVVHAELVFTKFLKTEKELEEGNFDNYQVFFENATPQALDFLLEMAAFYGRLDVVKETIAKGANGNVGRGAAVQMACRNGHLDVLKFLVESGTLNGLPQSSMLTEASENNRLEIMGYLLGDQNIFGIQLCDIHSEHDCALRTAVDSGHSEMVQLLIKFGANVNIFAGYLLVQAVKIKNKDIAKCLLDNGFDRQYLKDAIDRAKSLDNEMVDFLANY